MDKTKKELREKYKQTPIPMGVYQIRNLANGKVFLGSALNLPGILNSNRFQLNLGSHPNKKLQAEWKEFGGDSFVFEVLDELPATKWPGHDYKSDLKDLKSLEELWFEKLEPYEERGYHNKKVK